MSNSNTPLIFPAADTRIGTHPLKLSDALTRVTLSVKEPGADVQYGTTFYTPVETLLARTLGTRRQDLVRCAWPLLCCPYHFYDDALPAMYVNDMQSQKLVRVPFKQALDTKMALDKGKPVVTWEIIDMLQAMAKWNLQQIIEWVRVIERKIQRDHPGLLMQLQSMADTAREANDRDGVITRAPGMTEGIVIDVTDTRNMSAGTGKKSVN